jgi:Skp family chaperone for outer membrane proteins
MNMIQRIVVINVIALLFSPLALAAMENQIAVVNVTQLFNSSEYVKKANKELQSHLKDMEKKIRDQQNKMQTMAKDFESSKNKSEKEKLVDKFKTEQAKLTSMTQDYQKEIQTEQNSGMQQFSKLVQVAVSKVAKEKHINTVINSASIVYVDNSTWVDITPDVEKAMNKEQ